MGIPSCTSHLLHTHNVIDEVTRSTSRSNLKIAITWSVFIVHCGNKYCYNLWLTGCLFNTLKFWFGVWFDRSSEVKNQNHFREFSKSLFVHDRFSLTSDMKTGWQIVLNETISNMMTSSVTSQHDFEYCPLYSCL